MRRREFLALAASAAPAAPLPERTVVLTFDDAVKSHRSFVAPLLGELGFRATFFVTHRWMADAENFMSWEEIGELDRMGFEIGNHSWTHPDFSAPRNAARMASELYLVERMLEQAAKVRRPTSFAYSGNGFGPEAFERLAALGYKLARRGKQPEAAYGAGDQIGPAFDPKRHHPLLIPTTGDAYPDWTLEHFQRVVAQAGSGKAAVLQFHGVPDRAHPWVHTPPERFRQYMTYLKEHDFRVLALADLAPYIDFAHPPADPLIGARYPAPKGGGLKLPVEMEASRTEARYWLETMLAAFRYSYAEAAQVLGWSEQEVAAKAREFGLSKGGPSPSPALRILPYPGGREVRMGFFANLDPHRGTKAGVFLPWDASSYVVVDLPEAIFAGGKLLYLAHTHIPTVWDEQNVVLDNVDWTREPAGGLRCRRVLPNQVAIGAAIRPVSAQEAAMELWIENGSPVELKDLRAQVCVLLKGAPEFNAQTTANKVFRCPIAAVRSAGGGRWILTAWQRCVRAWGHPLVPCLHADPAFPDCAPGRSVRLQGRLWFHEGAELEAALARLEESWPVR